MLYNGNYFGNGNMAAYAVWSTLTTGKGATPCSLQVTSASGGSFSVVDANKNVLFLSSSIPQPATPSALSTGQTLPQGQQLFSTNGLYFLTVQADGNAVL